MFDFILPHLSVDYSLSDDLLKWYSIQFTKINQKIQINDGKILILDELDINRKRILFNGNVYVKNLTITTTGFSLNNLNFGNNGYSNVNCRVTI